MNDLISRGAALDALNGEITVTGRANAEAVLGYTKLIADRIKRLPSAQPERWIPVTESLPEDNEYVLVTTAEGGVTDAKYWHRERIWVKGLAIVNVTAWMSLPNPWRGEEDEQI